MLSQIVTVKNSTGIHARPAAQLAKALKGHDCRVTLRYEGKDVNASSMMNIMRAGIKAGGSVEVVCEGGDEAGVLHQVVTMFDQRFGEAE
ncbi:HPr family phosphocarrier protein [Pantoea sp. ME81]|uniref:HPr family phosphocarrier protein n=1 Tax=Pantoea sp. ME81 TaxID=2743935 RepID=UPI0015F73DDE|nr:HPr family phosphocarrier protein [Pantoea sp. ME81]